MKIGEFVPVPESVMNRAQQIWKIRHFWLCNRNFMLIIFMIGAYIVNDGVERLFA